MPLLMVVEDNDEDFEALSRILCKLGLENRFQRCVTGDECLETLGLGGGAANRDKRTLPGLILLDLNLPGTDGCDVLQAIKTDPYLKKIPVTVLTTSANPRDAATCYECGANAYVLKPLEYDELMETMRIMTNFWFRAAVLPPTTG
jgi:CheY-like chemotaxis protein